MKKIVMRSLAGACLLNGFAMGSAAAVESMTTAVDFEGHWKNYSKQVSKFDHESSKVLWTRAVKFDESRDVVRAVECMTLAAKKGHPDAQHTLSVWYRHGINGLAQDHDEAKKWLIKAADAGVVDAQCELGLWFLRLDETDRAIGCLTQAAQSGNEMAICQLEQMKEPHERSVDELLKCLIEVPHLIACQLIAEIKKCEPSKIFHQANIVRSLAREKRYAYLKSVISKIQ